MGFDGSWIGETRVMSKILFKNRTTFLLAISAQFTTGYFKTILIVVYLLWTPCRTKNHNLPDGPSPAEVPKGFQRVKWVVGGMSFFRRAALRPSWCIMDAIASNFFHSNILALLSTTSQHSPPFPLLFQHYNRRGKLRNTVVIEVDTCERSQEINGKINIFPAVFSHFHLSYANTTRHRMA